MFIKFDHKHIHFTISIISYYINSHADGFYMLLALADGLCGDKFQFTVIIFAKTDLKYRA